tara:strand:+ start:814 stop:1362 length:549 start_codon:yes stop_codon:yes gene_type:complete
MAIVFADGTQSHSGKLVQQVVNYYSTITSFSTDSNTAQRMWSFSFTPKIANSKIHHFVEFHGYYGSSGADRNFQCGMSNNTVDSSVHKFIGPNPNSQPSGNSTQLITGYHRGDTPGMSFVINFHNVITGNADGMAAWSAGDTLLFWADCVGENTYYHCQASQDGQGRFGRGRSKIILQEFIP